MFHVKHRGVGRDRNVGEADLAAARGFGGVEG